MIDATFLEIIYKYITGHISLEELEKWIVPRAPYIYESSHAERELLGKIELGLIEIKEEIIAESDLKKELSRFLCKNIGPSTSLGETIISSKDIATTSAKDLSGEKGKISCIKAY